MTSAVESVSIPTTDANDAIKSLEKGLDILSVKEEATLVGNEKIDPGMISDVSSNDSQSKVPQAASLYVGELDPGVTEAVLYEVFSMIGPVASIRVCRDAINRRSLGYAYVNYLNLRDSEIALEQLNYTQIKGRQCRIMWSQRDPALRKTGTGNIFIKNLDENIDNKALHDTFAAFGNILSCKVATNAAGKSLGHGFIHYEKVQSAKEAIEGVNGMLLNDKAVYVGWHQPKRERQAKADEAKKNFTNVYIKNIPLEVSTEELRAMFEKYGPVTSAVVTIDEEGSSKCFGFVNFENHEDASVAVDDLNEKEYKGSVLIVTRAQRKREREEELKKTYELKKEENSLLYQGVNLYIKNLSDEISEEKLREMFEPFGTITSVKVMADNGHSRGFGFVCFSAPDEATKALTEMNGKIVSNKPLYVGIAQRKEIRRQQLEAQAAQRNHLRQQQIASQMAMGMQTGGMFYHNPNIFPNGGQQRNGGYQQSGQIPQQMGGSGNNRRQYYQHSGPMGPQMAPQIPMNVSNFPTGNHLSQSQFNQNLNQSIGGNNQPGNNVNQQRQSNQRNPQQDNSRAGSKSRQPDELIPGTTFSSSMLVNSSPSVQKQLLGEAIYPRVSQTQPALAGKITGMLLDMDPSELIYLLENKEALNGKVLEALEVLEEYSRKAGQKSSEE